MLSRVLKLKETGWKPESNTDQEITVVSEIKEFILSQDLAFQEKIRGERQRLSSFNSLHRKEFHLSHDKAFNAVRISFPV